MTIIKATVLSYYEKEPISFYFHTRKSKIKVSNLVDEINKHLPISTDFSKEQYYSKTIKLDELFYVKLEDDEEKYVITFDLINPITIWESTMFILRPTQVVNQSQSQEEYRVEIKNGIEYFYRHCEQCNKETSWCPIMSCCEVCASQ